MGLREEEVAVEVAACALSVVYGALACAALGKLVHIHYYSKAWTPQKLFHVLVCAVAAARTVFFGIAAARDRTSLFKDLVTLDFTHEAGYILDQAPGILFFITYAVLLAQWADIYHTAKDTVRTLHRCWLPTLWVLVGGVSCVQAVVWVMFAASAFSRSNVRLYSASIIVVGLCAIGVGFAVYGRLIHKMFSGIPVELSIRRAKMRETATVTAVCSLCFLVRGALVVLLGVADVERWENFDDAPPAAHAAAMVGYYGVLEVLPMAVILVINRRLPPRMVRARSLNGTYGTPKALPPSTALLQ